MADEHRQVFADLDADRPLVLLPVRLETRFFLDHDPPELRVRIFPDVVHADGHVAALSPVEQELGHAFWRRTWRAGGAAADEDAAFAWLAGRLGPWRAAWVARRLQPTNAAEAPTAPVPEGTPLRPAPHFPRGVVSSAETRTWARLLPERWAVLGYYDNERIGTWWGNAIPDEVAMAPGPVGVEGEVDGRRLLEAQGLRWTFDFEEAERVGMGIRIDLGEIAEPVTVDGFSEIIVVGVRPDDRREDLEALLEAHRYTHGLDFVAQGTATNATETATAAPTLSAPDLGVLRAAELGGSVTAERPSLADEGVSLYRLVAADACSIALGLDTGNALDLAANHALSDLAHAEAMNQVLWPATWGYYFDHLLQGALTADQRGRVRDWSIEFVRGGGPLPTLLVGPQPYGLLPVSLVEAPAEPDGTVEHLEDVLVTIRPRWDASLENIPRLDPDSSDVPTSAEEEGEEAALVSSVLASVPHPTSFRLRRVDGMRATYASQYQVRLLLVAVACGALNDPSGNPYPDLDDNPAWQLWLTLDAALQTAASAWEQLDALETFVDGLETQDHSPDGIDYLQGWAEYTRTALIDFVEEHWERTEPMGWLRLRVPAITGKMGDLEDPSTFFAFHAEEDDYTPWTSPLVARGLDDDVATLAAWIERQIANLDDPAADEYDYSETFSLLRQLARWSVENAQDGDVSSLRAGLVTLAELVDANTDPVPELERLLREALGTASHRLDAWYTGIGAWRLARKRAERPRGVSVGGFGWLVDVRPRASTSASQGYVLGPSLSHATSAAILRSGWANFGGAADSAGLAVDLSSARVRRARGLVDGVRRGQDLAELLGSAFERSLHDASLDRWTEDLRQVALDATDDRGPTNRIVDGLLLARAWLAPEDATAEETAAKQHLDELLATTGADRPAIEAALAGLAGDLDAVADAAVAQTVFSLAQGNVAEATATLTASATGDVALPALRFADTPREAVTITHRLLLLVEAAATGGWPGAVVSGRSHAAPGLERWVAGLLGEAASYPLRVRFDDPSTGVPLSGPLDRTMADVGLSALDLVHLAPAGDEVGLGRLDAVLTAWAEGLRPTGISAAAVAVVETDRGDSSVDDLVLAARALRRVLTTARDLDGRDLVDPGATDAVSGVDVAALERRVDAVRAALEAGHDALAAALPESGSGVARGDVRSAMLALSGFDLPGSVPAGGDADALVTDGQALLAAVATRLAELDARIAEEQAVWSALDDIGRHELLAGRIQLLVGHALPIAPAFDAGNGAALDATFARGRLESRDAATAWLAASGRVDPAARRLRIAVDLVEAARDRVSFDFHLGQLPDHPEEPWVAAARPTVDDHGRLCLLTTGDAPNFTAPAAGLVLGTWTESLPRARQTAGIALHFDAPSARPPQAILLITAEADFDFALVRDSVKQTLDLTRIRMVGPETLQDLGQYLPALYLHEETSAGAAT